MTILSKIASEVSRNVGDSTTYPASRSNKQPAASCRLKLSQRATIRLTVPLARALANEAARCGLLPSDLARVLLSEALRQRLDTPHRERGQ
jgi:hypothetical protein